MTGYVYIMSNPAFSGERVKIGRTDKDPAKYRVKELSDTSIPEPFKCEYWALVDNPVKVEKRVFKVLQKFRPNPKREFFDVPIPDAIAAIQSSSVILAEKTFFKGPDKTASYQTSNKKHYKSKSNTQTGKKSDNHLHTILNLHDRLNPKKQGNADKGSHSHRRDNINPKSSENRDKSPSDSFWFRLFQGILFMVLFIVGIAGTRALQAWLF